MPLPIVWLGAAAVSAFAAKELAEHDRKKQQAKRESFTRVQTLADLGEHESPIAIYPSDIMDTEFSVAPRVGALVCCGIGGILDHTGIWVDDNTIIELDGEGLIKPISPKRFTQERTGKQIFIACDSSGQPICCLEAAERAVAQIYQYRDYHLIDNNCHNFIWQCYQPNDETITTFKSLNINLAKMFNRQIYWDLCDC